MLRRQRNLPISGTSRRRNRAPAGHGSPASRPRRGLTLVEMMVAVVVLSVGLLGLVGTAGVVTRQVGGGGRQSLVAQIVANRLDSFRSLSCAQISETGTATTRGITESWVKGPMVNKVLTVTHTVTYRLAGGPQKTQTFTITVPCGP